MKTNVMQVDIGNICDIQWFLEGYIVGMRHAGGDCPFDKTYLCSMEKAVEVLKEARDNE